MNTDYVNTKIKELFDRRIEQVSNFWSNLSYSETQKLLALNELLDGNSKKIENLPNDTKYSEEELFHINRYYRKKGDKRKTYRTSILDKKVATNKVAILLPHIIWTGGMRMIINLADNLKENGYSVDLFIPYKENNEAYVIDIGPNKREVITYKDDDYFKEISHQYDLAITTYWDQIYTAYKAFHNTIFFNQGDYNTFSNLPLTRKLLTNFYSIPIYHIGVSAFITHIMRNNYNRQSWIFPCSVNTSVFMPSETNYKKQYILIVGDTDNPYKNTMETVQNVLPIAKKHNLKIKWVSPTPINFSNSVVEKVISPSQEDLADIYKEALILVHGSLIEAFSLPPLEAMASGTPVVASNNMGILQYARDTENCLLFKFKDYNKMHKCIEQLLNDKTIYNKLRTEGLMTSNLYNNDNVDKNNIELLINEFLF